MLGAEVGQPAETTELCMQRRSVYIVIKKVGLVIQHCSKTKALENIVGLK